MTGIFSGEILFNGVPRDATFWRESSYVKQDDIHIALLTVRETLHFAAKLRMGKVSNLLHIATHGEKV